MQQTHDLAQLLAILQNRFGLDKFREGQAEAILTLLTSGRLLCIQPTGHGKSLLYQLPATILDGITLVISPLLALMRDQLHHLNTRFNIPAASVNSDQTGEENALALRAANEKRLKILFVAPEQLDDVERFSFLLNLPVSLIVVDEAHCISTWGHDFRPSYRQIVQLVKAIENKNPNVKVLGLTATADIKTEADIKQQLSTVASEVKVQRSNMDRPNIQLSVVKAHGIAEKLAIIEELVPSLTGDGLIYCSTRENAELVAEYLQQKKINIVAYHAGFMPEEKRVLQQNFIAGKYKIIAATNALGMGIDKANLRFIVHFDVPGSITAYYQEVGRSGRDGMPARGILLYDNSDKKVQQYFIDSAQPTIADFQNILHVIKQSTVSPNLMTIKRLTGLHPTRVTVVIAELVEQGFVRKVKQDGLQVYQVTNQAGEVDLSRYQNQYAVKTRELKAMLGYGEQKENCRMLILRKALGDINAVNCGHCDCCQQNFATSLCEDSKIATINSWLTQRTVKTDAVAAYKIASGVAVLDGKFHSPVFVKFMRERTASTAQDLGLSEELISLIKSQLNQLKKIYKFDSVVVIPSRTWGARNAIAELVADELQADLFLDFLQWQVLPAARQGELLNNDQRRFNVDKKMQHNRQQKPPSGALLLLDDYIGSGTTIKEAGRVLRKNVFFKYEIIPFVIAAVKWRLGAMGMV